MSCNCSPTTGFSPSGAALPRVSEVNGLALASEVPCGCVDTACSPSETSEGTALPSMWLDSVCAVKDVTLLGRVGATLARLAGNGFLQLTNGKVSVVSSIPLCVADLWHNWWKPTALSRPILGEPLAAPYHVVADAEGNLHGIKGLSDSDAFTYWNSEAGEFQTVTKAVLLTKLLPTYPTGGGNFVLAYSVAGGLQWLD